MLGFETLMMTKRLVSDLLDYWQLGHATDVRKPGSGVMNPTLLVSTAERSVVVRGHRRTSMAAVEHELAVIDHAITHGIPAPPPLPTPSGARVVEHEGRLYSLFEVAPGQELSLDELGPDRARAAGQLLAQVQDAPARFPMVKTASTAPSDSFRVPTPIDTLARIDRLVDHIERLDQPTPQDRRAAGRLQGHAAWLRHHPDYSLPPFPAEAPQMTHGDFHEQHLLRR